MFSLPLLLTLTAVAPPLDAVACEVLFRPKNPKDAAAVLADHGLVVRRHLRQIDWYLATSPCTETQLSSKSARVAQAQAAAQKLMSDARVRVAEPNWVPVVYATSDTLWQLQWALENVGQGNWPADNDVNAPEAWPTATGAGVVVAVIDTGVRHGHEDLSTQIDENAADGLDGVDNDDNGYVDDLIGWDFVDDDNDPDDPVGEFDRKAGSTLAHGTFVAGLIAAQTNNDQGIAGTAPDARLLPLRALGEGAGVAAASEAILYAVDRGVRVQNHSWGTLQQYVAIDDDAFRYARDHGAILVLAAGNENRDLDAPGDDDYPGELDNDAIITVGAMSRGDFLHVFSNHGPLAVDVAAPGGGALWSTSNIWSGGVRSTGSYSTSEGTSFAAPIVAAVVAMMLEVDPALDAPRARALLIASSDASRRDAGGTFAGSYVRADRALAYLQGAPAPPRSRIDAPWLEERSWLVNVGSTVDLRARVVDPDTAATGLHHHWQLNPPPGSQAALDAFDADRVSFVADVCGGYEVMHYVDDGVSETTIERRFVYAGFSRPISVETEATCASRPCFGVTTDEVSFDVSGGDGPLAVHLLSTDVDAIGGSVSVDADGRSISESEGKGGARWTASFDGPAEVTVFAYSSFEQRVGARVDAVFFCDGCPAGRFDCDDDADNRCESAVACVVPDVPDAPDDGAEGEGEGAQSEGEDEGEGEGAQSEGEGEGDGDAGRGGRGRGRADGDADVELVEIPRSCAAAGGAPVAAVLMLLLGRRRRGR